MFTATRTSRIRDIILNPTYGLVPYLDSHLEENWGRYQLRPYDFDENGKVKNGVKEGGLRFGAANSSVEGEGGTVFREKEILLGRMFMIGSADRNSPEVPIIASELCDELDDLIREWASCHCPGVRVGRIGGMVGRPQQRNGVSSEEEKAWWVALVRVFSIIYI